MTRGRAMTALRALLTSGGGVGLSDDQLLQRFADRQAEAETAFAALVDRHGPMVWGVCRRTLVDHAVAEDAFQATFVILARRAAAIRVDGSLGRWLHGVAHRVASRARLDRQNRRVREARARIIEPPGHDQTELLAALDEELARLPAKYRMPLILCHLEGLTYAAAAERLGCPPDTLKGRLTRARALLRSRLDRRGLAPPPAPALGSLLISIPPPATLTRTAALIGRSPIAPTILTLANGVQRTMTLIRLTKALAFLAPATIALGAFAVLAAQNPVPPAAPPVATPAPAPQAIDPATALYVPFPPPEDLHRLLRQAARDAIQLSKDKPDPRSFALRTLATAQAMAGDKAGARETFAAAIREGNGPDPFRRLQLIGQAQLETGLRDDARVTFQQALEVCPTIVNDLQKDNWTQMVLAEFVQDWVRLGDQDQARRIADRFTMSAANSLKNPVIGNQEELFAPQVAASLASVGDLDGAFTTAKNLQWADQILGKAALAAAEHLDPITTKLFIDRILTRFAEIAFADSKFPGLNDVAKAQARIGDIEGAKRIARSVDNGPFRFEQNRWDHRPGTLREVGEVQFRAGDPIGAAETFRESYQLTLEHLESPWIQSQLLFLAAGQVAVGDIEGAEKTVQAMREGQRSSSLADIARAQAAAGNIAAGRLTMTQALADARSEVKRPPDPNAAFLAQMGMRPVATDSGKLGGLAELAAMEGDVPAALKSVAAIGDERYRNITLQSVVRARAEAGDVFGALRIATKSAKSPEERRLALEGLGQGVESRLYREKRTRPAR